MTQFNNAYKQLLRAEGGYANDPDDRGGETYRGIARNHFPKWVGWIAIDLAKKKPGFPLSLESNGTLITTVALFYKDNFWTPNRLGEILNPNISMEMFDTGVNMGLKLPVMFLQRSLNLLNRNGKDYPDTKVDGVVGNATLQLVNNHKDQRKVYDLMNTLQGCRYVSICEADPTQEKYMNGWLNRVYEPYEI